MEYARPRKMSKSMSASQLAGMENGGGAGAGRPPLPPGSAADKLGPLGKPIRRTNTFRCGGGEPWVQVGVWDGGRAEGR